MSDKIKKLKNNLFMLKIIWSIRKNYIIFTFALSIMGSISPAMSNLLVKYALDVLIFPNIKNKLFFMLLIFAVYNIIYTLLLSYHDGIFLPLSLEEIDERILKQIFEKSKKNRHFRI